MSVQCEMLLISMLTALACALPGTFLVMQRMSMTSDAITHTALLGIVLAYFATGDLASPWLIVGAAGIGVCTVWCTQWLYQTGLMRADASLGIVYALFFSVAVILITRRVDAVHLDTDSVLLGELAFAPFDRVYAYGRDIGARAAYLSGGMLLVNAVFITVFFKELTITSFDPTLAHLLGFRPHAVQYMLMGAVSLSAIVAFEAVGSILAVAFMVGPALTASLLVKRLAALVLVAAAIALINAMVGFAYANAHDVSIAGGMAAATGVVFAIVFAFARDK